MKQQADPIESEAVQWVFERLAGALGSRQVDRDDRLRTFLLSRVLAALPLPGTRTLPGTVSRTSSPQPALASGEPAPNSSA